MPIRPEMRDRYPANWKAIRDRILERANHSCERCGVPNHWYVQRLNASAPSEWTVVGFHEIRASLWAAPEDVSCPVPDRKITRIVLTIAHVHDDAPENCDDDNLQALCQRCHLLLDAKLHAATRRARRAIGDLFDAVSPAP